MAWDQLSMIRPFIGIGFTALAFAAVAELREVPVSEAEQAGFAEACRYYEARAKLPYGGGQGEFVTFLAEACATAETLMGSGTPAQRARSALLLDRIAELRSTVARMNATRARRDGSGYVPVSLSGEFLIAHRLGVLLAFEAWLDTGVNFSVASYP